KTLIVLVLLTCSLAARAYTPSSSADIVPPQMPSSLKIEKTFSTVTVSWERVPRVSSYTVEYTVKRYFIWTSTHRVENYQSTAYQLRFPYSLSRYTFRVFAMAGPVSGPGTDPISVVSPLFGGAEFLAISRLAA